MNSIKIPRTIHIGGKGLVKKLTLGGTSPILLQTMWKESLLGADLHSIAKRLNEFEQLGCDIVRFAVPDMASAEQFVKLTRLTPMPLVADIHFDYKLALRCMDGNTAKIRINPGNIGSKEKTEAVIQKAKDTGTAIRIGVNSGSLPSDLKKQIEEAKMSRHPDKDKRAFEDEISVLRARALTEAAAREIEIFEKAGFKNAVVSMKASNVRETITANEIFAEKFDNPLHLGVTEAGPLIQGIVKTTIAFYRLLEQNIGSTIRVSLSDSCENEIIAGREILTECGKRQGGIRLISCPRCGRKGFDVQGFVKRWQTKLLSEKKDISIAVMGCVVNGPGEGKHADLGITGAEDSVIIFKHGSITKRLDLKNLTEEEKIEAVDTAFKEELQSL
ncbi:(E)-4-hydroxy-3-methylbut-2-enyl-diphosphate synthase [Treponema sp. OMZ 788]|uniref:(E)-4-hydroxy-3-methylbut-2-enyl-diphosphate synthase n=1 Tax=unclassified Treponema TaxID=2638727 RepID=UPI0020A4D487|nr:MULTISPECIES: (E)-4-hydroxy-3-methylbut-2-enyl-diphosphate synthase [unclassified Treponema]UTC63438.1 (E)-4-hydroxy-3-methylbut-2-enyl-diphosphate synthase [Treponema sp. OMZ 787]UTC63764.1 (E)-4-hydroxy-3-methylbut-2-enyl-diphosphate synthase [Treponema sp. OMZ 788]